MDRRLNFKEIPVILAKLERHSSLQRFNFSKCMRYIEVGVRFYTVIHWAKGLFLLLVTLAKLRCKYIFCFSISVNLFELVKKRHHKCNCLCSDFDVVTLLRSSIWLWSVFLSQNPRYFCLRNFHTSSRRRWVYQRCFIAKTNFQFIRRRELELVKF